MSKKLKFESFKFHFFRCAEILTDQLGVDERQHYLKFLMSLEIENLGQKAVINWEFPTSGRSAFEYRNLELYRRAVSSSRRDFCKNGGEYKDVVRDRNEELMLRYVSQIFMLSGLSKREKVERRDW